MQSGDRPYDPNERAEDSSLFEIMMGMTPEEWNTPVLPKGSEADD